MNVFTKLTVVLLLVAGGIYTASAQLYKKIGDNPFTLNSQSAALEVQSSNKGFLPPRMDTVARDNIARPVATGLIIYNLTTNSMEVNIGGASGPTWKSTLATNPGVKIVVNNYVATATDYTILSDPSVDNYFSNLPDHVMYIRLPENTTANPNNVAFGKIYVIGKYDDTDKSLDFFPPLWLSKTANINRVNYPRLFRVQYDGTKWCIID